MIDINSTHHYRLYINDATFANKFYNFTDQVIAIFLYTITGDPDIYVEFNKEALLGKPKFAGTGALIEQINIFPD